MDEVAPTAMLNHYLGLQGLRRRWGFTGTTLGPLGLHGGLQFGLAIEHHLPSWPLAG